MVEIVLVRLRISPGWPTRVMELFVRLLLAEQAWMRRGGVLATSYRRWLNAALEPILEEEGMYTESIFLDRSDDRLGLLWYMEAEEIGGVYDGFVESDHRLTDVAARVGGWLFEEPELILSRDVESDYPLLAHAWNTNRP